MSNKKNDNYTQSEYFSNNSSESSQHEDNIDCFVSNKKIYLLVNQTHFQHFQNQIKIYIF